MLTRVALAVLAYVVSPADAQAAIFWLQHCARRPLSPAELAHRFWRG